MCDGILALRCDSESQMSTCANETVGAVLTLAEIKEVAIPERAHALGKRLDTLIGHEVAGEERCQYNT